MDRKLAYGFSGVEDGKLVPSPEEMETVERIQELRNEGLAYQKISDSLKREGITSRNGNGFHPQQIKRIIEFHTSCEV